MKKLLAACVVLSLLTGNAMASGKSLKLGTESTFKPFEFRDAANQVVGFDMDLAAMVAQKLGCKLVIEDMAFDSLIPAVMGSKIDVAVAGITPTAERARVVDFSHSYYVTPDAFIVKTGGSFQPKSAQELRGKAIAVQLGTTQDLLVSKIPNVMVRRYQKTDDAVRDVLLGRADAACVDGTVSVDLLDGSADFRGKLHIAFTQPSGQEGFAFAISKKNGDLLSKVNAALDEIMISPAYGELKAKWRIQ